jgi:hypothetical protein
MKGIGLSIIILLAGRVLAQDRLLPNTYSPDKNVAIVEYRTANGVDYSFFDSKKKMKLGDVLPPILRGATIGGIKTSWSPDSAKVVLRVSYGTKLDALLLYSRIANGMIKPIELPDIDPISIYEKGKKKGFSRNDSGYDEDEIGPWVNNDTVRVVRGEAKEYETGTQHFIITLEIKVTGTRAKIHRLTRIGILSDEQSEQFLSSWRRELHQ